PDGRSSPGRLTCSEGRVLWAVAELRGAAVDIAAVPVPGGGGPFELPRCTLDHLEVAVRLHLVVPVAQRPEVGWAGAAASGRLLVVPGPGVVELALPRRGAAPRPDTVLVPGPDVVGERCRGSVPGVAEVEQPAAERLGDQPAPDAACSQRPGGHRCDGSITGQVRHRVQVDRRSGLGDGVIGMPPWGFQCGPARLATVIGPRWSGD